jgi:hypothetical protein
MLMSRITAFSEMVVVPTDATGDDDSIALHDRKHTGRDAALDHELTERVAISGERRRVFEAAHRSRRQRLVAKHAEVEVLASARVRDAHGERVRARFERGTTRRR